MTNLATSPVTVMDSSRRFSCSLHIVELRPTAAAMQRVNGGELGFPKDPPSSSEASLTRVSVEARIEPFGMVIRTAEHLWFVRVSDGKNQGFGFR
jgi:hypothetical protein